MLEGPVVEEPDRLALQRLLTAGKPVGAGALCCLAEELNQPGVRRSLQMAVEHKGDAESARGRIENELPRVVKDYFRRLQLRHSEGAAPDVKRVRHVPVQQDLDLAQVGRGTHLFEQIARSDRNYAAARQHP